jgi:hypothetical protein
MGEDFERERQEYFDKISGVGEWQGQSFGWSRWAWDIAWHPAMLRRGGPRRPPSRWEPFKPLIFLAVVAGIPALAIYLSGEGSLGMKIAIVGGVLAALVIAAFAAARVAMNRARSAAPKPFPHPGPKGHHRHR